MSISKRPACRLVAVSALALFFAPQLGLLRAQTNDPLAASLEAARRTRDGSHLQALKTQLEQRTKQNANNAQTQYQLAQVEAYLADVYEGRKDKRSANNAVDKAMEAAQRYLQVNEKSADAHSLLADLYGRKISLGNGIFAGPKYGPRKQTRHGPR